jgi:hypothetical protein
LSGRGLGCCRMHALLYLRLGYTVRGEDHGLRAGEVVVAHPSPAPGTVDGIRGDLGENDRVWLLDRSWVVYLEHPATRSMASDTI